MPTMRKEAFARGEGANGRIKLPGSFRPCSVSDFLFMILFPATASTCRGHLDPESKGRLDGTRGVKIPLKRILMPRRQTDKQKLFGDWFNLSMGENPTSTCEPGFGLDRSASNHQRSGFPP